MKSIELKKLRQIIKEELAAINEVDHSGIRDVVNVASKFLSAVEQFEADAPEHLKGTLSPHLDNIRTALEDMVSTPGSYVAKVKAEPKMVSLRPVKTEGALKEFDIRDPFGKKKKAKEKADADEVAAKEASSAESKKVTDEAQKNIMQVLNAILPKEVMAKVEVKSGPVADGAMGSDKMRDAPNQITFEFPRALGKFMNKDFYSKLKQGMDKFNYFEVRGAAIANPKLGIAVAFDEGAYNNGNGGFSRLVVFKHDQYGN